MRSTSEHRSYDGITVEQELMDRIIPDARRIVAM